MAEIHPRKPMSYYALSSLHMKKRKKERNQAWVSEDGRNNSVHVLKCQAHYIKLLFFFRKCVNKLYTELAASFRINAI